MSNKKNFVSVFHVDNKPILPPLMDEERRKEMINYRNLAISIENKRNNLISTSKMVSPPDEVKTLYINKKPSAKSEQVLKSLSKLNKTDTFIYDIKANTVIIPDEPLSKTEVLQIKKPIVLPTKTIEPSSSSQIINDSVNEVNKYKSYTKITSTPINDQFSDPTSNKENIASINNNETKEKLVENQYQKLDLKSYEKAIFANNDNIKLCPNDRLTNSTEQNNQKAKENSSSERPYISQESKQDNLILESPVISPQSLVRSNSFILDGPSPVLQRYLAKEKHENSLKSLAKKNEFLAINMGNVDQNLKNLKTKNSCKCDYKSSNANVVTPITVPLQKLKSRRSPYETSAKLKAARKLKNISSRSLVKQKSTSKNSSTEIKLIDQTESVQNIEKQTQIQLMNLLKKQQEEQLKMQKHFEKQQSLLIKQLNIALRLSQNPTDFMVNSSESNKYPNNSNCLEDQEAEKDVICFRQSPKDAVKTKISEAQECLEEVCATKICAVARGYIVRRLFKTRTVNEIVKTIKETLEFLIEFHKETETEDNEYNILLKARLMQQLSSSCFNLHKIFCVISPKERMTIIAKDREERQKQSSDD